MCHITTPNKTVYVNNSGYADPTAGAAITRICKKAAPTRKPIYRLAYKAVRK